MNFHYVVPYLELLIRNGLAAKVERSVPRYRTTAKGEEVLQHFRELNVPRSELRAMSESEEAFYHDALPRFNLVWI